MPEWNRLSKIRIEDLTSDSTLYDKESASPSYETLQVQWATSATLALSAAILNFLVILSILLAKKVREKAFNCYLIAVAFPDFLLSFFCFLTCMMNNIVSSYYSEPMCGFQAWYLTFGVSSNCWMNALIAREVYTMLKTSHFRGRYNPPTCKKVAKQAMGVYLYAAFVSSLATWKIPGVPLASGSYQGYYCFVKTYDTASIIFFWLVYVPAILVIPLVYVIWCSVQIYRRGMIPPAGRRKDLAIFFFRLIFVFVLFWMPTFVIAHLVSPITPGADNPWILWTGSIIGHLQGICSVVVMLMKPDIKKCFLATITCGQWGQQKKVPQVRALSWRKLCCCIRMKSEKQDNNKDTDLNDTANAGASELTATRNSLEISLECPGCESQTDRHIPSPNNVDMKIDEEVGDTKIDEEVGEGNEEDSVERNEPSETDAFDLELQGEWDSLCIDRGEKNDEPQSECHTPSNNHVGAVDEDDGSDTEVSVKQKEVSKKNRDSAYYLGRQW